METRQLLSLALSVIIVGTSVAAFRSATNVSNYGPAHQPMVIDGRPVVNFAPVVVQPTEQEIRDAFAMSADTMSADITSPRVGIGLLTHPDMNYTGARSTLTGWTDAAFAMPYYSFGTPLGTISKD